MYPSMSSKIKALHVMGGNFMGIGNVTKHAEFNFWYDAEAAHIVLNEVKCPLHILPWETCLNASLAMPHKEWRFGVLNTISSDIIKLMDVIEEKVHYRNNFIPCDALLIACFCFPQMIETVAHYNVTVELNGTHSRGQMIVDRCFDEEKNAFVIESANVELFKKILCWVCGHDIKDFMI
jgi:inosine-uridine nucleoside N-ribohydrolase